MKEQRDDESLEKARELADQELERFGWKDGLLVHREDDIRWQSLLKIGCFRTAVWGVGMSTPLLLLIGCSLSHRLRV